MGTGQRHASWRQVWLIVAVVLGVAAVLVAAIVPLGSATDETVRNGVRTIVTRQERILGADNFLPVLVYFLVPTGVAWFCLQHRGIHRGGVVAAGVFAVCWALVSAAGMLLLPASTALLIAALGKPAATAASPHTA